MVIFLTFNIILSTTISLYIVPAPKIIAVDIPDDRRDKRREPTRENDHRRISINRPNPIPKTRGPSRSSSTLDIAIVALIIEV